MALLADLHKRGYYPIWQSIDHEGIFPGSRLFFVIVTVSCSAVSLQRPPDPSRSQGDESWRVETLSDIEIQAEVMEVLRTMFPEITVPEPESMLLHRWHQDPLYRGSYSNWPSS